MTTIHLLTPKQKEKLLAALRRVLEEADPAAGLIEGKKLLEAHPNDWKEWTKDLLVRGDWAVWPGKKTVVHFCEKTGLLNPNDKDCPKCCRPVPDWVKGLRSAGSK